MSQSTDTLRKDRIEILELKSRGNEKFTEEPNSICKQAELELAEATRSEEHKAKKMKRHSRVSGACETPPGRPSHTQRRLQSEKEVERISGEAVTQNFQI